DASCEDEVVALLAELRRTAVGARSPAVGARSPAVGARSETAPQPRGTAPQPPDGREAHFNAEQNDLVVKNAEHYYRTMVHGGPESWNIRDRHMTETLGRLMRHHGPQAQAIVWAHNTHIGDARFTDMADDGM